MVDLNPLTISRSSLPSEVIRQALGERNVDLWESLRNNNRGLSKRERLKGFGSSVMFGFLDFIVTNLGQYIITSLLTLYTYDWNKTDAEIQQEINSLDQAIFQQAGQLAANGLIYGAGMAITTNISMRYPVIDSKVAYMVAEEGGEEIRSSIRSFFTATRGALAKKMILSTYLSGRQMIFGAQTQKKEPWIASDQLDKLVDSNKDANVKAFWNGFKDQAEDAVFDLLFIINMGIVGQWEGHKRSRNMVLGQNRIVKIKPDGDHSTHEIWLEGRTQNLIPQITQATTTHRVMADKDVGQIVADRVDAVYKDGSILRKCIITYSSAEDGKGAVLTSNGWKKAIRTKHSLSNIKTTVTWQDFKTALKPYTRGNYCCTAMWESKTQTQVYAVSEAEGKDFLQNLQVLTTDDLMKTAQSHQEPKSLKLKKDPIRMYPNSVTLEIRVPTTVDDKVGFRDKRTGQGYELRIVRFKVFPDTEPRNLPSLATGLDA